MKTVIYFKVLAGLVLIVGLWQIRDCLKTKRISRRYGSVDVLWRERPQAYWAYIMLYGLITAGGAVLFLAIWNK